MTQRSVPMVVLLSIVTCHLYGIYHLVATKDEMNERGAEIPTAWLLILPFIGYYWMWKYAQGVEKLTGGASSAVAVFLLNIFCASFGISTAMNQAAFNKVS